MNLLYIALTMFLYLVISFFSILFNETIGVVASVIMFFAVVAGLVWSYVHVWRPLTRRILEKELKKLRYNFSRTNKQGRNGL